MDGLLQDIRYAFRTFLANRAVTLVAVLVLALGIGATTTIYSVVEGVLLRPLPYRDPGRVVEIMPIAQKFFTPERLLGSMPTVGELRAWRAQNRSFVALSAYEGSTPVLTGLGDATRIDAWAVQSNLFPLLGVQPMLGRAFTAEEDLPGSVPVAVLSYAFWATRFGRDPSVLGRSITLDGTNYRIVGVMPPRFRFPVLPAGFHSTGTDVWRSAGSPHAIPTDERASLWIVGRLRPTVSVAQARTDLDGVLRRMAATDARLKDMVTIVVPVRDTAVGDVRPALVVALAAVGLVLLIACANVANLLLARAAARQREIAIRVALGASRMRIVRQLLTESVLLALAGTALGVLLATWGVPLIVTLAGRELPRIQGVGINLHVLAAAVGVALLTGLLFGLAPAVQSVRGISPSALKEGSAGSGTGTGQARASGAFVILQVALTLVLLVGAGLLGRSFLALMTLRPGFQPDHVLVAHLVLPHARYGNTAQILAFARNVEDRARALPGVETAAVSTGMPLSVGSFGTVTVPGQAEQTDAPPASFTAVTPDFFSALGIPLRRGRVFRSSDRGGAQQVVVNEALARTFFPGQDPIGKRISFHGGTHESTIIGIVGNTRQFSLAEAPRPVIYEPLADDAHTYLKVVLRTAGDPASLAAPLRATLHELDPNLPIDDVQTMRQMMAESITTQRFYTTLLGIFSTLALLMAAAGLYALVSYAVVRRTRELGIRLALGALPHDVLRLVVGRGARLALAGILLGVGGALAATRVLRSFLFEITPTDPVVFVGVALGLAAVALVASWLPARRATRIDPVAVLRDE